MYHSVPYPVLRKLLMNLVLWILVFCLFYHRKQSQTPTKKLNKHRSIIVNGLLKSNLEKNCTKMTEQSKQPILNECTKHHFCSNFANGARKAPLEKQRQRRHRWGCIRNFTIIAKKVNCDWLINNQESLMGTMPLKWKCLCVHCLWNSIFFK